MLAPSPAHILPSLPGTSPAHSFYSTLGPCPHTKTLYLQLPEHLLLVQLSQHYGLLPGSVRALTVTFRQGGHSR